MSHLIIQRKRTQAIRAKMHSQQSHNSAPRRSVGRILNDHISKRRFTTVSSSPKQSEDIGSVTNQIQQAKQLFKNKNTKSALAAFLKLHKKHGKNSEICYFIGSCFLNDSNFESALQYFKYCLPLDANFNKNIYIYMAICYKSLGKIKQAIQILQQACFKHPKFKDAIFYKGKLHLSCGAFKEAILCFQKCNKIDSTDSRVKLYLADSYKANGSYELALQFYQDLVNLNNKISQKAFVKKISVLVQMRKFKDVNSLIKNKNINNKQLETQVTFIRAICEQNLQNYQQAITLFQLTLASNSGQYFTNKAFQHLIQISMKQKDFFGAEHLISRSRFQTGNHDKLKLYCFLVEAINDLIKKKLKQCEQKLQHVYTKSLKHTNQSNTFLNYFCLPYYAYCLFSLQKYQKSLQMYRQMYLPQKDKSIQKYNGLICQGVVLHRRKQYVEAQKKFKQASVTINNKIQPIFLICVNIIQSRKGELQNQKSRQQIFKFMQYNFKTTESIQSKSSLFLFYQSLVQLFQGKNATAVIDKAINISQQQISQYYFIQGLSYSLIGETLKGLQSISKAIQIDQTIPQFFKQRSKYYYVLQRYDEAVSDIANMLNQTQDQQAKLLLTFYYYMTSEYGLSYDLLKEVSKQCSQDKFKQFQIALCFRLHIYEKCGTIGKIISAIINKQTVTNKFINQYIDKNINERQTYSQFTIYFFHIVLSAYYFYEHRFQSSLQHLFGALEQIQITAASECTENQIIECLLNQIKFNITVTSLSKQLHVRKNVNQASLQQTYKYIQMFLSETEDPDFITNINAILNLLKQRNACKKQKIIEVQIGKSLSKLSDDFPKSIITINDKISIETKFIIYYPQKLKFNITPQFDQSFLYNFDIDKIQSKLCPPWFKLHNGHVAFTDKIRNQSILISQTDKAQTPALVSPNPTFESIKQKFKLDDAIEKKLQKIINRNTNNKK